jgi:arylsulfatase A-like enzyme
MSDNQSWNHAGIYGDRVVKTPNIDSIGHYGVRFSNAFCAAPSSAPARAGFLTGQDIWRLEDGANLRGTLSDKFETYTDILEENGYAVGFQGKGWGPGEYLPGGRKRNPAGTEYPSFEAFLNQNRKGERPWTFWFSSHEPHRPYVGLADVSNIDFSKIEVPPYLPDVDSVRWDIANYYASIELFDKEIGKIIEQLKKSGQSDHTVIVVCSDNGWQMPRGLANLYDSGARVPLIISYSKWSQKERKLGDFVNLNDLAPTFLDLANIPIPENFTAKSLLPSLLSNQESGIADSSRTVVFTARERHAFVRKHGLGYPGRAIRTKDYLYIRNYEPERWPAGDPPLYGDVDANNLQYTAPTKVYILKHKDETLLKPFYDLSFAKRPLDELYDLSKDSHQLKNVAYNPTYKAIKEELEKQLDTYLKKAGDPRALNRELIWDTIPYYNENDKRPVPSEENRKALNLQLFYNYINN